MEKLLLPDLIVKDAYFGYLTKIEMSSSINYFQDLVFFTENIGGRKRTGLIKRGVTFDITKNGIKLPYSSDELYFNGHDSLFSSIEFYGNQDGEKNKSIPGTPSSGSIKLRPKETAIYCIENIIVDPENLVIESNENNNELKKGGCINVGPDIIIERLHFYSVVFEGGRATKPSKIINAKVGDAVIIGLEAIDVNQEYFSAHGSSYDYLVESKIIIKKNGLPIKEGKPSAGIFGKRKDDLYSRDVSFTFTEAGEYCLDGETDITNAVKEYNENNNKVENSQCITVTEVLLSPPVLKTKGQQCSSSTECSSGNCLNSVCELAGAECNARVSCATGKECKDNKCITVTQVPPPTPEPIPQPIPTLKSVECNGCLDKDICLPFGFRIEGKYCNTDKSLKVQKEEELSCNNNFECLSNQCSNNKCINLQKQLREQVGLLKKIWCKLFHPLNENNYNACLVETLS
ncbi:hypothetical protein HYX16_02025 [Candidatus Woesearchaeota archaeon]|nr:hypothetical protein [Candidatus Woesearchaeota archaeon]